MCVGMSLSACPCRHVLVSLSLSACPCQLVLVSLFLSACPCQRLSASLPVPCFVPCLGLVFACSLCSPGLSLPSHPLCPSSVPMSEPVLFTNSLRTWFASPALSLASRLSSKRMATAWCAGSSTHTSRLSRDSPPTSMCLRGDRDEMTKALSHPVMNGPAGEGGGGGRFYQSKCLKGGSRERLASAGSIRGHQRIKQPRAPLRAGEPLISKIKVFSVWAGDACMQRGFGEIVGENQHSRAARRAGSRTFPSMASLVRKKTNTPRSCRGC